MESKKKCKFLKKKDSKIRIGFNKQLGVQSTECALKKASSEKCYEINQKYKNITGNEVGSNTECHFFANSKLSCEIDCCSFMEE